MQVLTFSAVARQIRTVFEGFVDQRRWEEHPVQLERCGVECVFGLFFMQSPSFLDLQRTMQETHGKNNAQTLFGVYQIPCDNQIRSLLDPVAPSSAYPLFHFVFDGLQQAGILDLYRAAGQRLLLAMDGVVYDGWR